MNRILLQPGEVRADGRVRLEGRRARHILEVLHAQAGQDVRVGVLNGAAGTATVEESGDGAVLLACRMERAEPPPRPLDLLLALPRPKVLKRLWAPLASLGVRRILLTNAAKVERNYFDTHWLQPEHYEPLLIEGLEQAGDTRMPEVGVRRRLRPLVEDELPRLCPAGTRIVAHPHAGRRLRDLCPRADEPVLLAVGPEGGWTDFELDLLIRNGFTAAGLGPRTLRSDVACIALVSVLREMAH